jgi:hypothetical protein
MRARAVLREAWRDIVSGTSRIAVFALVFGLLVGGVAAADQLTVRRLVSEAEQYRAAGASIVTLAAEGRIRGDVCEGLGRLPGVRAAGALRQEDDGLRLAALPQSPLALYTVTPHLPEVLSAASDGNGVVLSADAAAAAGRSRGDAVATVSGTTRIAGVYDYPSDGRRVGFGYAALDVSAEPALYDECWVDAWPLDDRIDALLLTTVQPSGDADDGLQLSRVNTTLGTTFDGASAFAGRLTSDAWVVALVGSLVVGYVSVRIRRVALASALHTRVPRRSLGAILALETGSWVVPVAIVLLGATAVFAAAGPPADRAMTLVLTARVLAPAIAAAFVGAAGAFVTTRERHLFRYVRDR